MKQWHVWKTWVVALVCIAALSGLVGTSQSFEDCIHQSKTHKRYEALHDRSSLFIKPLTRLKLHAACVRETASQNDGAIAGLSGVAVAIFTGTLWWVTWSMVQIAQEQRADTLRAIKATEDNAVAAQKSAEAAILAIGSERAWISHDNFITGSARDYIVDGTLLTLGKVIQFRWKNWGRSPAIKVQIVILYRIVPAGDPVPFFDKIWDAATNDTVTLGPNGTVLSTQVIIGDLKLKSVLDRVDALYIFSAVRYRDVYNSSILRVSEVCVKFENTKVPDISLSLETSFMSANWVIKPEGSQNTTS